MDGLRHYLKAFRYPRRAAVELYGISRNFIFNGNGGDYVMNQDWDNLVILDACRYDIFEDVVSPQIDGELQRFKSRGTHTGEFIRQNFKGKEFLDTVYVSSNPNPSEFNARFYDVISVWDKGWDDDLHTVPPDVMTEVTLEAATDYPNKRILTHYLQPHYPFIGKLGKNFHAKYGYTDLSKNNNMWTKMRRGEVSKAAAWEAYVENLEILLPYIKDLIDEFVGRTVLSSDHGNAFGEYGVYGHPPRAYIPCLQQVPWFIVDSKDRKKIVPGKRSVTTKTDSENLNERLADLGYV